MSDKHFYGYEWEAGFNKVSDCDPNYPTTFLSWRPDGIAASEADWAEEGSSVFGFIQEGQASVVIEGMGSFVLQKGQSFVARDKVTIRGGSGFLIVRHGYKAWNTVSQAVEEVGRLKYIDGCTDSLIIGPVKLGDPCLNHLHFPAGIDQTQHTHPSDRIGVVYAGEGECETPDEVIKLTAGMLFRIPAEGLHKFRTFDSNMEVIAYHPDSDFGPQDENHPMINRTIVEGVSAAKLDDIRTQ